MIIVTRISHQKFTDSHMQRYYNVLIIMGSPRPVFAFGGEFCCGRDVQQAHMQVLVVKLRRLLFLHAL